MALAFVEDTHEYFDRATGEVLISVTQMLEQAGLVDARWYTEASAWRGHEVHRLCTDLDLGAFKRADLDSPYLGYLAAYEDARRVLQPTWEYVEVLMRHPRAFAGRPDRVGVMHNQPFVVEIKSGAVEPAHRVQTALQAHLAAAVTGARPEAFSRAALYVHKDGSWHIMPHRHHAADYREAERVWKACGL